MLALRFLMHLLCLLSALWPCFPLQVEGESHPPGLTTTGAAATAASPAVHHHHQPELMSSLMTRLLQQETTTAAATGEGGGGCDITTDAGCTTNPQAICDSYNNAVNSSVGNCTCQRFGKLDTTILCELFNDCSNATITNCYNGTIERILNPQLITLTVMACVRFPNAETNPEALTCIRTYPLTAGNFSELNSTLPCVVEFTPTGQDPKRCRSCSVCDTTTGEGSTTPAISFDCCNLQTDLQQSCYAITDQGIGIPNFDPILKPGTCTSAAVAAGWDVVTAASVAALMTGLVSMIWI
jgi:hypothetical protein